MMAVTIFCLKKNLWVGNMWSDIIKIVKLPPKEKKNPGIDWCEEIRTAYRIRDLKTKGTILCG